MSSATIPDRPNRGADVLILTGVHSGGNLLPCLADGFADGVVDEPGAAWSIAADDRSEPAGDLLERRRRWRSRWIRGSPERPVAAALEATGAAPPEGHRLERPQLMERRARPLRQGGPQGGGLREGASGWTSGRVALRLDRPRPSPFTVAGPRGQRGARGLATDMSLANCQVSDRCPTCPPCMARLLVRARPSSAARTIRTSPPRAGLVDRRVGPPRNTDDPLCGRPVVRLGNEDRAAMR